MSFNLLNALPSVVRLPTALTSQPVTITFTPALPPQVRAQIATQNLDKPFTLTVSGTTGNQLTFTGPGGTTFIATVNPPLPLGTQLQLNIADILPGAPAPSPATLPLQATILPPATSGTSPSTQGPQAAPPVATILPSPPANSAAPTLTLQIPASATTAPALQNLVTTTILQTVFQPTTQSSSLTPNSSILTPLPVPAGPVAVTLPATLPPTLIGQSLVLIPTQSPQPNGTQPATLANPTLPSQAPVPVTLNLGVALPLRTPQSAILLPSTEPNQPPVLIFTGNNPVPPAAPQTGLQLQPATPQPAPAAPAPTTTQPITLTPTIPVAGRILPPAPNQPANTQTVLLATGTTAILKLDPKSPQPLPTGSIIVADLPITNNTGVQRVLTADAQSQPQQNLAQNTQAAAPVAPQTTHAVLAAGALVQGTITGQNEQGQPLLTITQPGNLSGQTVPLTLTGNNALLPVGAQLTIRVEANLSATILTLTLPPQTQAAYTLGTIGARWEGLQQALHALQQQAPVQAANLRASLPQLSNLMPGLIAFTNALRTNRLGDAFDTEATRLLKSMGIDLSADIAQLSQLQQRPGPESQTQWRGTLFPYVEAAGEDPRQGGFFWRREKSDNPRSPTSTRFVVEVEMSKLGPIQLDGLISYPDVWLKLRQTRPVDADFTSGLQQLVNSLLSEYGLAGGIAVETTATFPINPRTELLGQTENPLPTTA